jgi:hypothetical protein
MTYNLPLELQNSYLGRRNYPKNLIPSGTTTYRSKLVSYKKRLEEAESDLCLVEGQDAVDDIFEIVMIDLATGDGKGAFHSDTHRYCIATNDSQYGIRETYILPRNSRIGSLSVWCKTQAIQMGSRWLLRKETLSAVSCTFRDHFATLQALNIQISLRRKFTRQAKDDSGQSLPDPVVPSGHARLPGLYACFRSSK